MDLAAGATRTVTFQNTQGGRIIVGKSASGPDAGNAQFGFAASYNSDGFKLGNGETNPSGYLRPGTYTVGEIVSLLPAGWRLDHVTGLGEADQFVDPATVRVQLASGVDRDLVFFNVQRIPTPALFRYDPIYPDGVGTGTLSYGSFSRPPVVGGSSVAGGTPGAGDGVAATTGAALPEPGAELVADEGDDIKPKKPVPKHVRLGSNVGQSSFETFNSAGATP